MKMNRIRAALYIVGEMINEVHQLLVDRTLVANKIIHYCLTNPGDMLRVSADGEYIRILANGQPLFCPSQSLLHECSLEHTIYEYYLDIKFILTHE